jgi:hypothetical protein
MRKQKPLVILASLALVTIAAVVIWLLTKPASSGWLCCITNPTNGSTICVSVKGLDSECEGGTIGWCDDYTEDAAGEATCHDH